MFIEAGLLLALCVDHVGLGTEAVVTAENELVFQTQTNEPATVSELVVLNLSNPQEEVYRSRVSQGMNKRQSGPVVWGLTDGAYYCLSVVDGFGLPSMTAPVWRLEDRIEFARSRDQEAQRRMLEYGRIHGRHPDPLQKTIQRLLVLGELSDESWDLYYDFAYTAPNDVTLLVIRQGELRFRTFNKPAEDDWNDRGTIQTEINTPFRIEQAGDALYLIDAEGRVFSSPSVGHRQVGVITGWERVGENDELILFEDQARNKIGAVVVANDTATVLPFAGDEGSAADFITTIPDDLAAALLEMARILREAGE